MRCFEQVELTNRSDVRASEGVLDAYGWKKIIALLMFCEGRTPTGFGIDLMKDNIYKLPGLN